MEKLWFVPDVHRPYHDKRAWALMMKAAKGFNPDVVTTIGDFGDWYAVSAHSKDPRKATRIDAEIADANVGLDELDALKAKRKIYVRGNHCLRLETYLRDKAPELHGELDLAQKYQLKERGWEDVAYRDHTTIGKLYVTHDVGVAGKNALWSALALFEHSVVTGHTHRLGYVVEGNALGTTKVSASFGWLGDVGQVDYMSRAKAMKEWSLAFGYGFHDRSTGYVYLIPVPIVDYHATVDGTLYHEAKPRGLKRGRVAA